MRKKPTLQQLRAAKRKDRRRFFSEIIYPYLKDYRRMNQQEFEGYNINRLGRTGPEIPHSLSLWG